ncbi:MAG: sugar phosphate isomerase/epimerase [Acidobacteriota bacterium]
MLSRRHLLAAAALPAARALALPLAQFPLGVTTDEIDDDVLTAIKMLKEFGLKWAEIRNIYGKYNTAQPKEKIHEVRSLLDEHAIRVNVLGTGFFKVPLPDDSPAGRTALDAQWTLLDGAIERAQILGTNKVRIFGFTYPNGEQPAATAYPRIYELLREASRRTKAKSKAIRLCIENVGQSYIWTGEQAGRLLKEVKEENIGLTWDPNNAAETGEQSFPTGFAHLDTARIHHVHLRDFRKAATGKVEWCAVGEGIMDNLGQLRALRKAHVDCSYTLETHWKSPQGKAHATRTSLTALLKVIEQV